MAKVKVTFENITVTNNGEGSGKGELYWLFQVDGETVNQRTVSNALKVADGETISLGPHAKSANPPDRPSLSMARCQKRMT